MSKERFVDFVATSDLGRLAAGLLWEKLMEAKVCDELTPYPDDDLHKVFGLAEEDLDEDIVLAVIEETRSTIPSKDVLEKFGAVNTPADIVRLIEVGNAGGSTDR